MIRVSVMYPNESDKFDMDYYLNKHIPLVHQRLDSFGLVRTEVDKGIGTQEPGAPAPYAVIAHLIFNSIEEMEKGWRPTIRNWPAMCRILRISNHNSRLVK